MWLFLVCVRYRYEYKRSILWFWVKEVIKKFNLNSNLIEKETTIAFSHPQATPSFKIYRQGNDVLCLGFSNHHKHHHHLPLPLPQPIVKNFDNNNFLWKTKKKPQQNILPSISVASDMRLYKAASLLYITFSKQSLDDEALL